MKIMTNPTLGFVAGIDRDPGNMLPDLPPADSLFETARVNLSLALIETDNALFDLTLSDGEINTEGLLGKAIDRLKTGLGWVVDRWKVLAASLSDRLFWFDVQLRRQISAATDTKASLDLSASIDTISYSEYTEINDLIRRAGAIITANAAKPCNIPAAIAEKFPDGLHIPVQLTHHELKLHQWTTSRITAALIDARTKILPILKSFSRLDAGIAAAATAIRTDTDDMDAATDEKRQLRIAIEQVSIVITAANRLMAALLNIADHLQ